jgi:hypothetical protein
MYADLRPDEQIDIRLRALECLLAVVISRAFPREAPAQFEDALNTIFHAVKTKAAGDPATIQRNFDTITERAHVVLDMAAKATTAFEAQGRDKG